MKMKPKRREPDLMDRTQANVAYLNATKADEEAQIFAFLSLFHPNLTLEQKRRLSRKDS